MASRLPIIFVIVVLPLLLLAVRAAGDNKGRTLPLQPARTLDFDVDEGTWMSLDISPDGKTIVFDLLGDLYTIDSTGGRARLISGGLPFDSQPTYSPNGSKIAFISDRSGNENLWISKPDGSEPKQISSADNNEVFISPGWAADGQSIFVSTFKPDLNAFEIWQYDCEGRGKQVTHAKASPDQAKEQRTNALGATASRDGKYLFYEEKTGKGFDDELTFPLWRVVRRNLSTGEEETVVTAQGSAMRPVLSSDGHQIVYATRFDGKTALRVRNLLSGDDHWLLYPVQQDEQEASASRDLLPRYAFTPDAKALVLSYGGKIQRFDMATRTAQVIPFTTHVSLPVGPSLRQSIKAETGPVRARLAQWPSQSPDGRKVVFSALGKIYTLDVDTGATHRLTQSKEPEFQPSWSPDGKSIVYVTWTARGGSIWRVPADGTGSPVRLTNVEAYYTNPVFSPDGESVIALRSSNYARMHVRLEWGSLRQADVIRIAAKGGEANVITSGSFGGAPQFTRDKERVFLLSQNGLDSFSLDGSGRRSVLQVNGPGFYFQEGSVPADDLRISPDGKWALAQIVQQIHLVKVPPEASKAKTIELGEPAPTHRKLTITGADFFSWADGGRTITWALGSTFYRRSLESVAPDGNMGSGRLPDNSEALPIRVEVPRDAPHSEMLLRGASAITMKGDELIKNADVLIKDDRIAAIGRRGQFSVPAGIEVRDLTGKFLLPGLVDTHLHYAEVRRGVLDLENWGFLANLAYGVTTGLDPSPLSIDALAYQDLIEAGITLGPRVYSTGPALFSFNQLQSEGEAEELLRRFPDFYRTRNIKEYRTGNRRVREWIVEASNKLHLLPTTEGALDMKLDLTQIQDGFPGNEHALTAVPLYADVVQLLARTRVSYTPTLEITNAGLPAQNYFLSSDSPHDDPKVNRFIPHYIIDEKAQRLRWARPEEYLYPRVAESVAKVLRAGGLVGVGSHGEFEGLAYHWELQALSAGGLTPQEVLRAATIGSSEAIGRKEELGSLESGKFADILVLDKNPLTDIKNTLSIRQVMKNGRLYDANTLNEVWPRQRELPPLWFWKEGIHASQ